MKGGSGPWKQEPFNEVIASRICSRLAIPCVDYSLIFEGKRPFSLCENFITQETELIPAWRIFQTQSRPVKRSLFDHFIICCEGLCFSGAKDALDRMLTLDFIIANEDRHWHNFGLVRNAETLEITGFAPLYDSGSSLWYNSDLSVVGSCTRSKPFCMSHDEQILLVSDFDWFDREALEGLEDEIISILSSSADVNADRSAAIATAVMARCACHMG